MPGEGEEAKLLQKAKLWTDRFQLPVTEEHEKDFACIICLDFRTNVLFLPCKHAVYCAACFVQNPTTTCPLCRTTITKALLAKPYLQHALSTGFNPNTKLEQEEWARQEEEKEKQETEARREEEEKKLQSENYLYSYNFY